MPSWTSHFEALEDRRLLAFSGTFTDTDGDSYTIELVGNGNVQVTTKDAGASDGDPATGFIQQLRTLGTDASSRLSILVTKALSGDGRVPLLSASTTLLRSAKMPAVDAASGGTLIFEDVGQFEFGGSSGTVDIDVGVNPFGVSLGKRTAVFGQVDQAHIRFRAAPATLTFKGSNNLVLTLDQGAGLVSSAGPLVANFSSAASIKEIRIAGAANLCGTIEGDVTKLTAPSFADNPTPLQITGLLGTLSSPGSNAAAIHAGRFGTITLGSLSNAELLYSTPDAKGVAIASLRVGEIANSQIGTDGAQGSTPGRIKTLTAVSMTNAAISASSIPTIKVTSGIAYSSIHLLDTAGTSLGALTVGDLIAATEIETEGAAGIGSIKALGLSADQFGTPAAVETTINAGFLKSLKLGLGAEGGVRESDIFLRGADTAGFALKAADFGAGVFSSSIVTTDPAAGNFGSLKAVEFNGHNIRAPRINSVLVTGRDDGIAVQDGTLFGTSEAVGGFALGTITLKGDLIDTLIASVGSIKSFSAAAVSEGTRVRAGRTDFDAGFPADLSQYNADAHIKSITLTKAFQPAPAFALNAAVFVAPTIDSIVVKGLVNTTGQDDFGQAFGFGARVFGKVTIQNASNQTVKPTIPTTPGIFNPFTPDAAGNFQFLIYA